MLVPAFASLSRGGDGEGRARGNGDLRQALLSLPIFERLTAKHETASRSPVGGCIEFVCLGADLGRGVERALFLLPSPGKIVVGGLAGIRDHRAQGVEEKEGATPPPLPAHVLAVDVAVRHVCALSRRFFAPESAVEREALRALGLLELGERLFYTKLVFPMASGV